MVTVHLFSSRLFRAPPSLPPSVTMVPPLWVSQAACVIDDAGNRTGRQLPEHPLLCPSLCLRSPPPLSLFLSLGSIESPIRANQPILNKMTDEQEADKVVWTPSTMIERLGREIDDEESIYYWCAKVRKCAQPPVQYPRPTPTVALWKAHYNWVLVFLFFSIV